MIGLRDFCYDVVLALKENKSMNSETVIEFKKITKNYRTGDGITQKVLRGLSFKIKKGDFLSIMGPSGSGKSTCMNIIGCLDQPTGGEYWLADRNVANLNQKHLAKIRNQTFGFVFQNFNLLAKRNLIDNVALPLVYRGENSQSRKKLALELLEKVDLKGFENYLPTQLSGGMKQRVAIARALVGNPQVILADEPTGNLDTKTSHEILNLFKKLNKDNGVTIVMITHEDDIATFGQKTIHIRDGLIE